MIWGKFWFLPFFSWLVLFVLPYITHLTNKNKNAILLFVVIPGFKLGFRSHDFAQKEI